MYVILWEFRVSESRRDEFEHVYSAHGDWAKLFERSEDFLGTTLVRDTSDSARYVKIDRWRTQTSFDQFKSEFINDYVELDHKCERLTAAETLIGRFVVPDHSATASRPL